MINNGHYTHKWIKYTCNNIYKVKILNVDNFHTGKDIVTYNSTWQIHCPGMVDFWWSGDCFDTFYIYPMFCS